DGPVLVFTVAITLVATIVSGLVPALVSSKGNAAEIMKEGGRGNSSRLVNIITRALVVGQIALTAALLIAATLQIKSIRNQITLNYGYDESRSEEHTSELQSQSNLVCRLLLEKKKKA